VISNNIKIKGKISSIHAEDACMTTLEKLYQHKKIRKRAKFYLLVIRLNRIKELKNSRPCSRCIKRISKSPLASRIQGVFYSNSDGGISYEKLSELVQNGSSHVCRGDRMYRRKYHK
jgi:hypothetical protein